MLLLTIALIAAAPGNADWREFDRRLRGWSETPAFYDATHIERRGGNARMWVRYRVAMSGEPDVATRIRVEIDCARRRSRALEIVESRSDMIENDGLYVMHERRPVRRLLHAGLRPIAARSLEDALARRVCPRGYPQERARRTLRPIELPPATIELPSGSVALPPSIIGSKAYRCTDNGLYYVDFYNNNTATIRRNRDGAPTLLTGPGGNTPLIGGGYSLSGGGDSTTINGMSCRA